MCLNICPIIIILLKVCTCQISDTENAVQKCKEFKKREHRFSPSVVGRVMIIVRSNAIKKLFIDSVGKSMGNVTISTRVFPLELINSSVQQGVYTLFHQIRIFCRFRW